MNGNMRCEKQIAAQEGVSRYIDIISTILDLNAGDFIEFEVYKGGNTRSAYGTEWRTSFMMELM